MRYYIVFLFVMLSSSVFAQEKNAILFKVGWGTFSMKDQKQLQNDYSIYSGLPVVPVHEFPSYLTFGGSASFKVSPSISIGIWGEYTSTAGRLHYQDYSGYVILDQTLNFFQAGPFMQYHVNNSNTWPIHITLHGSVGKTKEKIISEIEVSGQFESERYDLESINLGLRPGVMISHSVRALIFQVALGLELQLKHGELKDVSDKNVDFGTSQGDEFTAQWDGLRVSLGVGFTF